MKVIQWVNTPDKEEMQINTNILAGNSAYRIAFQALPGTQFEITGNSENELDADVYNRNLIGSTGLTMGHTGIYEIGFTNAIITGFKITKIVDTNSIMILDALLYSDSGSSAANYALTAQDFDYLEGASNTSIYSMTNSNWEGGNS